MGSRDSPSATPSAVRSARTRSRDSAGPPRTTRRPHRSPVQNRSGRRGSPSRNGAPIHSRAQDRDLQSVSKASAPRRSVSPGSFLVRWIVALAVLGGVGLIVGSMVKSGTSAVRGVVDDVRGAIPTAEVADHRERRTRAGRPGEGSPADQPARPARRAAPARARGARPRAHLPARGRAHRRDAVAQGRQAAQRPAAGRRRGAAGLLHDARAASRRATRSPTRRSTPARPPHLIKSANRRLGRRASQVNYLVLTGSGGELTWGVYYKDGAIAQGDRRGRFTRRIS